jgi:hypothetical protein
MTATPSLISLHAADFIGEKHSGEIRDITVRRIITLEIISVKPT